MNSKVLAVFLAVLFGVAMSAPDAAENKLMGEFSIYYRHLFTVFLTHILYLPNRYQAMLSCSFWKICNH